MAVNAVVSIDELSRKALEQRLLQARPQPSYEEVERQISTLENILSTHFTDETLVAHGTVVHSTGDGLYHALEEFILDTRAYADYSMRLGRFLHYEPCPRPTQSPVMDEGASGWIARQISVLDDPHTITRVSHCLPCQPASYRLDKADRDALVLRISARKKWRQTLVSVWVGEMERFLAMKSFIQDTDASKLSPSGYVDAMWHELILVRLFIYLVFRIGTESQAP